MMGWRVTFGNALWPKTGARSFHPPDGRRRSHAAPIAVVAHRAVEVFGAAGAAGVGLWLLWPKHGASAADPPLVGFAASPTSAAVEAGWRF